MSIMKRIGIWAFYAIGSLAILYLALHAYAAISRHELKPGDPIHIFRNPGAPSYSEGACCRREQGPVPGLFKISDIHGKTPVPRAIS